MRAFIPLAFAVAARAAEPMDAWPASPGPMTDADLAFRPLDDEEYTESMSFDAKGTDGTMVGLTVVATNIGIGDDSAGARVSLTIAGRTRRFSEEPDRWQRHPKRLGLVVGGTHVRGTLDEIHLEHGNRDFGFDLVFRPLAPAWRPGSGHTTFGADRHRFYEYSLPMPMARVEGKVRTGSSWRAFSGVGYVDHSRVNLYPHEQATRWYRFRAPVGEGILQLSAFQASARWGGGMAGWIVVIDPGRITYESTRLRLDLRDLHPDPEHPSYRVPWTYVFGAGDALSGQVRSLEPPSRLDYLSTMGALKRWVVSRFATPVGYSLRGDLEGELRAGGTTRKLRGSGEMSQTFIK
jgi:hypothetical protein